MAETTHGELLLVGLARVKEGLEMIGQAGGRADLVRLLATSKDGARQLREMLRGPELLNQLVRGMVRARNNRLTPATVDGIIDDFLGVLSELAQPVEKQAEPSEGGGTVG